MCGRLGQIGGRKTTSIEDEEVDVDCEDCQEGDHCGQCQCCRSCDPYMNGMDTDDIGPVVGQEYSERVDDV
jgi:hypothetical protein